jgi:hypothetical protein
MFSIYCCLADSLSYHQFCPWNHSRFNLHFCSNFDCSLNFVSPRFPWFSLSFVTLFSWYNITENPFAIPHLRTIAFWGVQGFMSSCFHLWDGLWWIEKILMSISKMNIDQSQMWFYRIMAILQSGLYWKLSINWSLSMTFVTMEMYDFFISKICN